MTQPFDDEHGDRLRRALHAEAEAVTPSAEGLERIRSKINQRRERRLGFIFISYSAPWLRPLAAVTAALAVCLVAVSVTPALANFVQTGHFSPDSSSDGSRSGQADGRSHGQVLPGESSPLLPSTSPSPSSPLPSGEGATVVPGMSCAPGEVTATPSSTPNKGASKLTCQSPPVNGGDSSTTPPAASTPPSSSEEPPADPSSDSAPAVGSNQSP